METAVSQRCLQSSIAVVCKKSVQAQAEASENSLCSPPKTNVPRTADDAPRRCREDGSGIKLRDDPWIGNTGTKRHVWARACVNVRCWLAPELTFLTTYAAPPVGELRWRPPQPASWQGTLDATRFKPACVQIGGSLPGSPPEQNSEDCLGLNIWTPTTRADEKLAVMVFFRGGRFKNGSSAPRLYWGDTLARKGIVFVTVNYRIGALGFLAHPELSAESPHKVSGNYAILDCIAALKWVKDNIAAFGGDPANVTVFGQSAGAYLGSELMASPLANGLFARVIGMSGADMGVAASVGDMPLKAQAEANGCMRCAESGAPTGTCSRRCHLGRRLRQWVW